MDKSIAGVMMNERGAENRATCAMNKANLKVHSACLLVRLQHFHFGPKMHHHKGRVDLQGAARCKYDYTSAQPCEYFCDKSQHRYVVDAAFCNRSTALKNCR